MSSIVTILQVVLSVIIAGVLMASTSAQNLATDFIMRIAGDKGDEYIEIFVSTVRQVVKGVIGVAVIQTMIQAVGLFYVWRSFSRDFNVVVFDSFHHTSWTNHCEYWSNSLSIFNRR